MSDGTKTLRLKVSSRVAEVVAKGAPREVRLKTARGASSLKVEELLAALFFLSHDEDTEVRSQARHTLASLPAADLLPALQKDLHPQILDFLARVRIEDTEIMTPILAHPALSVATVVHAASRAKGQVLALAGQCAKRFGHSPEIVKAFLANPASGGDREISRKVTPEPNTPPSDPPPASPALEEKPEEEGVSDSEEEDLNLSKYQLALEMEIPEKIKVAMTGDKEWRSIFIKETNKLVCTAVLKNPRITEGEVLMVAKNRSSNEELIRLITLNREWVKHYEIKKALVQHPRTPLAKALRYMDVLTEKDLKSIVRGRNVSPVIMNNARRMLMLKEKRK